MESDLKYLLKTEIKYINYAFNSKKYQIIAGILMHLFLWILALILSFSIIKIESQEFFSLFFITLFFIDFIYKIITYRLRQINFQFFQINKSKKACIKYIYLRSLVSPVNLFTPLFVVAFHDVLLVVKFLIISIISTLFTVLIKYVGKYNLLIYSIFLLLLVSLQFNIKLELSHQVIMLILVLVIISYFFLKTVYNFFSSRKEMLAGSKIKSLLTIKSLKGNNLVINDFFLFLRNKRPRSYLVSGLAISILPLIILLEGGLSTGYYEYFIFLILSGGFLYSLWQITPFWDSAFFPFFMTNSKLSDYINSKFLLINTLQLITCILLSVPVYFINKDYLFILISSCLINIGVSSKLLFLLSVPNSSRIDITASPLFNYDGINRINIFSTLFILFLSVLLFEIFNFFLKKNTTLIILSSMGVLSVFFNRVFIKFVLNRFKSYKYKLLLKYSDKF